MKKPSFKSILKIGTRVALTIGVGAIIGKGVKSLVPLGDAKLLEKICVGIGSFVLSSLVVDAASDYVCEQIDAVGELFKVSEENNDEETVIFEESDTGDIKRTESIKKIA